MSKLEIACVICGLIGILVYQPLSLRIENGNIADIFPVIMLIVRNICFLAMIVLPLYFRLWR